LNVLRIRYFVNKSPIHSDLKPTDENTRVDELIAKVIKVIGHHLGDIPFKVYLFGSRAKDNAIEGADVDLAIACPELTEGDFRKIKQEIAAIRTLYSIDLIHLERVDSDFREIVLADARKIYG